MNGNSGLHPHQLFVAGDSPIAPQAQEGGDLLSHDSVVALADKLYNLHSLPPHEIAKINSLLMHVQARNASLELPEKLLQSHSQTTRFYGANLLDDLARKLSPGLSSDKKDFVKDKYVKYLAFAIQHDFGFLEFDKLGRACVALYKSVHHWPDIFSSLLHAVFEGNSDGLAEFDRMSNLSFADRSVSSARLAHDVDTGFFQLYRNDPNDRINQLQSLITSCDDAKAERLISFMAMLVEDIDPAKLELPDVDRVEVEQSFVITCQTMLPVLSAMMNKQSLFQARHTPTNVVSLLLSNHILLQSSAQNDVDTRVIYPLRTIWLQILQKLVHSTDGGTWRAAEEVIDRVFRSFSRWISQKTLSDLLGFACDAEVGLLRYADSEPDDEDEDVMRHAARRMCSHLGLFAMQMGQLESKESTAFLRIVQFMATSFDLDTEGCEWAQLNIAFWIGYVEHLSTNFLQVDDSNKYELETLVQPLLIAITFIFPALALPDDPDDFLADNILDLQLDAQSLFAQAYVFFKGNIGVGFGRNPIPGFLMQTEPNSSNYGTATPELAMRTLSGLAEEFEGDSTIDPTLCLIFNSRLFEPLTDKAQMTAPRKSREVDACIEFLTEYSTLLMRNPEHLPKAVAFLFSILELGVNAHDPEIGKAMKAICSDCRFKLVPHFDSLVEKYEILQENCFYFPEAKVDILASLAVIALAVDNERHNLEAVTRVIDIMQDEVVMFESLPDPDDDSFTQDGIDALQAICEMGKMMRVGGTKERPILLDDDEDGDEDVTEESLVEQADDLSQRITSMMSTLAASPLLRGSDDAFQSIWGILQLSLQPLGEASNYHSAIFNFSPNIYLEVLRLCTDLGLTADHGFEVFGQMLTAKYSSQQDTASVASGESGAESEESELRSVAKNGFPLCIQYLSKCASANDGGDSMQGPLKLLLTYITSCPDIVGSHAAEFPYIVDLVTPAVSSSNVFTQEAACNVWSTILRRTTTEEAFVDKVSEFQLQVLALNVAHQVAGQALQRALQPLASVLAAMGIRAGPCKSALEGAFRHMEAQGIKLASGWTRFVQQIFLLRGNVSDTYRVTEQFWKADKVAKTQLAGTAEEEDGEEDAAAAQIVLLDD